MCASYTFSVSTSYELMLKCWALDPEERPTPVDIVGTLTPLDGPCHHDSSDIAEVHEEDSKSNGVTQNGNHNTSKCLPCRIRRKSMLP